MREYIRKRQNASVNRHQGDFVPKAEREQLAQEVKRTHFSFGSEAGTSQQLHSFRQLVEIPSS